MNTLEPVMENHHSSGDSIKQNELEKVLINANSDLDLQILEMIEKFEGVWKCRVCGKLDSQKQSIQRHAERHIEGMSHVCSICNKSYPNRPTLRNHINTIHSELLTCDLCGKSGMKKKDYYNHKTRQHKSLPGTH